MKWRELREMVVANGNCTVVVAEVIDYIFEGGKVMVLSRER